MKERPIIFDAESVRAILAGRKTQTRRVIKRQPPPDAFAFPLQKCPYGRTGDRLWVKETWAECDGEIAYLADVLNKYGQENADSKRVRLDYGIKWKSPLFMPRRLIRITPEVVGVRFERLYDISLEDVLAEGIEPDMHDSQYWRENTGVRFAERGDAINGKRGYPWAGNWWLWVVEFKLLGGSNGN